MFSVTIWRNDTSAENKGKVEFKVEDKDKANIFQAQFLRNELPDFVVWKDVNDVWGGLRSAAISRVEIKEVR